MLAPLACGSKNGIWTESSIGASNPKLESGRSSMASAATATLFRIISRRLSFCVIGMRLVLGGNGIGGKLFSRVVQDIKNFRPGGAGLVEVDGLPRDGTRQAD